MSENTCFFAMKHRAGLPNHFCSSPPIKKSMDDWEVQGGWVSGGCMARTDRIQSGPAGAKYSLPGRTCRLRERKGLLAVLQYTEFQRDWVT